MAYETYFLAVLAGTIGFIGGFLRAVVSLLMTKSFGMKIKWGWWLFTAIVGGVVGIVAGVVFSSNYYFSALAGFAGMDILKSVKSSFLKQRYKRTEVK